MVYDWNFNVSFQNINQKRHKICLPDIELCILYYNTSPLEMPYGSIVNNARGPWEKYVW